MTTLEDLLPTLAKLAARRADRRSLAELAREARSSASTFQRAFTRLVGESPKQYTRRLQLEAAALAIVASDASVLDVALEAGFESHEGFTRAFAQHFGVPPRELRERYAHLVVDAARILHTGPCVGLYRSPLNEHHLEGRTVNYDITRQHIKESVFFYGEGRCSHADIAKTLGPLLGRAYGHAMKNGLALASPPTTLYEAWGPGMVTLRAGFMVGAASPAEGLSVETLPACEAAVTIHTGPYDGLADAHAALEQYLHEHGLTKGGAAREVYLTDPGEVPDPKQWKTQVAWPIRA